MKKKLLLALLAFTFSFSFTSCMDVDEFLEEDDSSGEVNSNRSLIGTSGDPNQTWAVYWYLCGSDLESESNAASIDLEEMFQVELPENVTVVIETGGAYQWGNSDIDPNVIGRYVYSSEGFELVDEQDIANMGEAETLADFLGFCTENYPADKEMVLFWDHGGGSVAGAACDENFGYDSLTLDEFDAAFSYIFGDSQEPPLEVVGFDTCLMATVDVAATFANYGKYLVASEEYEPGGGWQYTNWLQALADDPGMDGARLGQHICETYYEGCEWDGSEDQTTLSVTDLGKIGPLLEAYDQMGSEALNCALEDGSFFGAFGRKAENTENYGGNTRNEGYSNMLDLGNLAENCSQILPETSGKVISALNDCILYKVNGPYCSESSGLSCYYSYNGDPDDLEGFKNVGYSDSFKYYMDYLVNGELTDEGIDYINDDFGYEYDYEDEELPYVGDLEEDGEEDYPLYLDDDANAVLELDLDIVNMLKGVYFELAYYDEEDDVMLLLGQDNDIDQNWDEGIFKDNFRGVWGAIDGNYVYMEVAYEADDYTAYAVPILLNGEEYNLRVIYDYNDEQYYILGARKGMFESGMADKNLVQLKPGDEITTIHYASSISGDDDFEPVEMDTFTVTENTSFAEEDLGDGDFLMMFELVDLRNNYAYSQLISFSVQGEECEVEILE